MPSVGFAVSCGQGWDSGESFILAVNAQTMQALLGGRGAAAGASCWDRACLAPREEAQAQAAQPALSHGILPTATPLKPGRNGTRPTMGLVCGARTGFLLTPSVRHDHCVPVGQKRGTNLEQMESSRGGCASLPRGVLVTDIRSPMGLRCHLMEQNI